MQAYGKDLLLNECLLPFIDVSWIGWLIYRLSFYDRDDELYLSLSTIPSYLDKTSAVSILLFPSDVSIAICHFKVVRKSKSSIVVCRRRLCVSIKAI